MLEDLQSTRFDMPVLPGLPRDMLDSLEADATPTALIHKNGTLLAMNHAFLNALGFDEGDDLTGLRFAAFWRHHERHLVQSAIASAAGQDPVTLALGLSYLTGQHAGCTLGFEAAGPNHVKASLSAGQAR